MKLIKNIVVTNAKNKNLLINSLNGLIDKIDDETLEIIERWYNLDEINPENDFESELFVNLKNRGYLVSNHAKEQEKKNDIICKLKEQQSKKRKGASDITFVLTYDCNFRCPYCFENEASKNSLCHNVSNDTNSSVMSIQQIDKAFTLVGDELENIGIFGGEPLLPHNAKALKHIFKKAPDKNYSITSNGYYLDYFIDLLKTVQISYIMITIDGAKEKHDSRRFLRGGQPTFDKIIKNIELCLKNNIPVRIRMNLDKDNLTECIEMREQMQNKFSSQNEILSFELSPMLEMTNRDKNSIYKELATLDINKDDREREKNNSMMHRFSPIINSIVTGERLMPVYSFCNAHDTGLIVDPHGYIYPCLVAVGIEELAVGKYYPEIFYFEKSVRTRNIESIPKCRECRYSLLCGGGCPVKLGNYSDINTPECESILNQIHSVLPCFLDIVKEKK